MRFRAGLSLIYPVLLGVTLTSGIIFTAGCGGGSSSPPPGPAPVPTPTPTPTPVPSVPVPLRSAIIWGPRSRQQPVVNAVGGPSSALSARLTLTRVDGTGTPFVQVVNRGVQTGRQEYNSAPQTLQPGLYNLSARFFALNDAAGAEVGTAAATATVENNGTLSTTIATFGAIQRVEVPANQVVNVGQTRDIIYSPLDAQGNVVAVTPGSAFITLVSQVSTVPGEPAARVQGEQITGVNPTRATVTVKVDDAVSPATSVVIRSAVQLSVNPNPALVSILQTQQFTPTLVNDGPAGANGVTYTVQEGASAGTVTAGGVFTATRNESPDGAPYTLVVRSVYDPDIVVNVPVTVRSLVEVTIAPPPDPILQKDVFQFTATVSQVPANTPEDEQGVTWAVSPGGGTIDPQTGVYTAPAVNGDFQITATSRFDTRKSQTITIRVRSLAQIEFTATPPDPILQKDTFQFTAVVNNLPLTIPDSERGVTWAVSPGGGTIDPVTGLYTAPAVDGDFVVTATSLYDPNTTRTLNIRVRSLADVDINPVAFPVSIRDSRTFTAVVRNLPAATPPAERAVTWSVQTAGGGTIDAATGVYTAPATPGNYVIRATSVYDPTKFEEVTVPVVSGNLPIIIQ